jgi:stearoyl-CoA desaturase (delta-9 desaturase)
LSHTYGYRNFETKDSSKNNWFISLILWGEGWHNNHHRNPGNFTTKIKYWEVDPIGYCIDIFRKKT